MKPSAEGAQTLCESANCAVGRRARNWTRKWPVRCAAGQAPIEQARCARCGGRATHVLPWSSSSLKSRAPVSFNFSYSCHHLFALYSHQHRLCRISLCLTWIPLSLRGEASCSQNDLHTKTSTCLGACAHPLQTLHFFSTLRAVGCNKRLDVGHCCLSFSLSLARTLSSRRCTRPCRPLVQPSVHTAPCCTSAMISMSLLLSASSLNMRFLSSVIPYCASSAHKSRIRAYRGLCLYIQRVRFMNS